MVPAFYALRLSWFYFIFLEAQHQWRSLLVKSRLVPGSKGKGKGKRRRGKGKGRGWGGWFSGGKGGNPDPRGPYLPHYPPTQNRKRPLSQGDQALEEWRRAKAARWAEQQQQQQQEQRQQGEQQQQNEDPNQDNQEVPDPQTETVAEQQGGGGGTPVAPSTHPRQRFQEKEPEDLQRFPEFPEEGEKPPVWSSNVPWRWIPPRGEDGEPLLDWEAVGESLQDLDKAILGAAEALAELRLSLVGV